MKLGWLKRLYGSAHGKANNAVTGFAHGWRQARLGQPGSGAMGNLPPIYNRMARVGKRIGAHPARYMAGGAITAAGAGGGLYAYRNHDPEYALYLGGKRGNKVIPAAQINRWMKREVDPHLQGYSLDTMSGVWKGTHEPSRVITYFGPRKHERQIKRIAQSYRQKFGQESVLMTTRAAPKMTFLS